MAAVVEFMVLKLLKRGSMEGGELTRGEVLSLLARLAFATAASYFTVKLLVSAMDPTSKQKKDAKRKVRTLRQSKPGVWLKEWKRNEQILILSFIKVLWK